MDSCGAIRRHDTVFTVVVLRKFLLKDFAIIIRVLVPAITHGILNDFDFMFRYPGSSHEDLFHLVSPRSFDTGVAGIPTTVIPSGTSFITTAPAPTIASAPILMWGRTVAPAHIHALTPTCTRPHKVAPGATSTPSSRTSSWSTLALVLMMHCRPIVASGAITAPARICEPDPIVALSATHAVGCTIVTGVNPSFTRRS